MAGRTDRIHARHAPCPSRPAVHYKGNYGNLLFFWDVLFGTARITRTYPTSYGVENLPETSLGEQLAWPIFGRIPREETAPEPVAEATVRSAV